MSYQAYKLLHLIGIVFLFTAVGGTVFLRFAGVRRALGEAAAQRLDATRVVGIIHGVALLLILLSGFGALARLDLMGGGIPGWIWWKLLIWALLGASVAVARKKPRSSAVLWWLLPLLGSAAAWLALYKPF